MRRRLMALCCCALALLSGCAGRAEETPPEGAYGVYYAVSDDKKSAAAVACEYHTLPEGGKPIPALIALLLDRPTQAGLKSPFPQGVRMLSWQLSDGQLRLNLSEQYGGLSGVGLTVADYCIALTLCQVEGVESVYVTVEGEEIPFRHTQQLCAADVILSGAEEAAVHVGVNLWFPRAQGDGLGVEYRQVLKTEDDTLRGAVLAAWLAGPEFQSLASWAPEGTEIRSVSVENAVCYVNLSAAFLDGAPADPTQARLLLYSLVNTMGALEQVEAVQLLIEGEGVPSYGGVPAGEPLKPDPSLEK